jgi:hypothetical protein
MRFMRARDTALVCLLFAMAGSMGCWSPQAPKPYEYEEEIYLALDGSATVHVNGSIPALVALRGMALDPNPRARFDRGRIRETFTSSVTRVTRLGTSRREGRRFVHVRLAVDDIRSLTSAAPFAWSRYSIERRGDLVVFEQSVGKAEVRPVPDVGWNGSEVMAFRVHAPSRILFHNALPENLRRGNILVWEQSLAERLAGEPLRMEAHLEGESILYRTLWLFGLCLAAVALTFALVIWWIARKGRTAEATL